MDQMDHFPAESSWNRFLKSGRVEDYLKYKSAAASLAASEEISHAENDRGPGSAGS